MNIISLAPCSLQKGKTCIALGMFDGVHMGHRRIITAAENKSTELGIPMSVLLFSRSPHMASELLPLCDRLCELEKLGVNYAYVYDFEEIRELSPREFVLGELCEKIGAAAVFAGYNYRFGARAAGDADMLMSLCNEGGAECFVTGRVSAFGDTVSSTRIRALLEAGDVEGANRLLAYPYYLRAEVVHGKELGRRLGVPTINQSFSQRHVKMAHGIYYTKTTVGKKTYLSVSNVGNRPTVEDAECANLETHILGFDGDLYGKTVKVEFFGRGRGEIRFSDVDALKEEILRDCERARRFFEK